MKFILIFLNFLLIYSSSLLIKVNTLSNFPCFQNSEKFCNSYFIISLISDQIQIFSNTIKCSKNPGWFQEFEFHPNQEENLIKIDFYQFISSDFLNEIINLDNKNLKNYFPNNPIRAFLEISYENIPFGYSKHFLMIKQNFKEPDFKLPSCLEIEIIKENNEINNIDFNKYENNSFNKTIKNNIYCKNDYLNFFQNENNNNSSFCLDSNENFIINNQLEKNVYATLLKKYFLKLKNKKLNIEFLKYYYYYLCTREDLQNDLNVFLSKIKINHSKTLDKIMQTKFNIKETSNYLNDIVASFIKQSNNKKNINDLKKKQFRFIETQNLTSKSKNNQFNKSNLSITSYNVTKELQYFKKYYMGYRQENIMKNFPKNTDIVCPDDFICLLSDKKAMKLHSDDISDESYILLFIYFF